MPLNGLVAGADGYISRTTDGGENWTTIPSVTGQLFMVCIFLNTRAWAVGSFGTIIISTDMVFPGDYSIIQQPILFIPFAFPAKVLAGLLVKGNAFSE